MAAWNPSAMHATSAMSAKTTEVGFLVPPAAGAQTATVHRDTICVDGRSYALSVLTRRAELDALAADWGDLFERCGKPHQVFQTFGWMWHWANHFLADGQGSDTALRLVTLRQDGRLVLVWPLVEERRLTLRRLCWAGEPVSQYGDVLVEDGPETGELLRTAWREILVRLRPDVVCLRKVRADAVVAPLMAEIGARALERATAPYLDLSSAPTFEAYEQRYSAKARRNRRRLLRRLEERGPLSFDRAEPGSAAAGCRVELAVVMKRSWLKDRGLVSPALADPRTARFFRDAAGSAAHATGSEVLTLTSGGETAAVSVSFACKDRLMGHLIVYGLKFEKAGAGCLVIGEMIRQAKSNGIRIFDLMAPGDAYKTDWADGATAVVDHMVPVSLAGRLWTCAAQTLSRRRIKAALAAMPTPLRRLLSAAAATVSAVF